MSNNRIFAGSRYETQGRNVNLTGTMFKRSPIFTHQAAEKVETSPFANYNCKTGQSFLSESQTTIPEDRLTLDAVRQLVKEELGKNNAPEESNRKLMHTLQAQITDLKQRIAEYEKENNKKIKQTVLTLREDFHAQAQKMGKDVEMQISNKLRSFFQKANLQLKKDILKTAEEEFMSIAEADDFQNRLEALNQKIESINTFISNNQVSANQEKNTQPTVLAQHVQAKMAKLEKELEQNKKQLADFLPKLRAIEEWKQEEINKRNEKILQQKIEHMREKMKMIEQEVQKKIGSIQIKQTGTEGDINIMKEKIAELQKNHEEQSVLFLDFSKKISSKGKEGEGSDLTNSLNITEKQLDISVDLTVFKNNSQQLEESSIKKQVYQVDSEGYLMDGDRKYLLTQDNKMIKLSQEHIDALLSSQAIEIIQK